MHNWSLLNQYLHVCCENKLVNYSMYTYIKSALYVLSCRPFYLENSCFFFSNHIPSFLLILWIKRWHYRSIFFFLILPVFSKISCSNQVFFLIIKIEHGFLALVSLCKRPHSGLVILFTSATPPVHSYLVLCKLLVSFTKAFLLCVHFPIIFHLCVHPATHVLIFRLRSWKAGNVFAFSVSQCIQCNRRHL